MISSGASKLGFWHGESGFRQDGSYLLESLEDGRHYVEILVDGKVVGRTQFVLQAADVNETVVDTLSDGTQRVQYPKGQ